MKRVLILGGYGNFGSHIARSLAPNPGILLLIAGRSFERASAMAASLEAANRAEALSIDVAKDLGTNLREAAPDMVIHTVGPFQGQSIRLPKPCISNGCHYVRPFGRTSVRRRH